MYLDTFYGIIRVKFIKKVIYGTITIKRNVKKSRTQ